MKNVMKWFFRIVCIVIIAAAAFTLIRSLMHINDDYSRERYVMEGRLGEPSPPAEEEASLGQTAEQVIAQAEEDSVEENPSVVLYDNGSITVNHPYTIVTAAFGDIINSVVAELVWYVDGEEVSREAEHLLVDGSTVNYTVEIDPTQEGEDTAEVSLEINFKQKTLSGDTTVDIERLGSEGSIVIQTEEIPVTADRDTDVYSDKTLSGRIGEFKKDDVGLMLDYSTDNSGLKALCLQLPDGSQGWVAAEDATISQEDCTTDEDYTEEMKTQFVNSMKYDSPTKYLVWVSLYTQKVNIFTGVEGEWTLEKAFDCASGANNSPTTAGVYTYSEKKDRWDLGTTYVEPVLIYNGGEAFTSCPYSTRTGKIDDDTIGKPVSGGSVRLREEDIQWMADNVTVGTLVVVY